MRGNKKMKTGFNDLDKIIKSNKKQVILITSTDEIENIFALNLVKNIAIDENIKTALFTNIDLENQESMTHHIIERSVSLASQIQEYLIQIHNE